MTSLQREIFHKNINSYYKCILALQKSEAFRLKLNNGRLLGCLVAADLPGKFHCSRSSAHAQNTVNNGNLPGKSAAT